MTQIAARGLMRRPSACHACPWRARSDGGRRWFRVAHGDPQTGPELARSSSAGCGPQPSKLVMRVRACP